MDAGHVFLLHGRKICQQYNGGIFCACGDSGFGFLCETVTMWCVTVPIGMLAAFVLKLPVLAVYIYMIVNLDEVSKLPAVYRHYIQYKWVKDLSVKQEVVISR